MNKAEYKCWGNVFLTLKTIFTALTSAYMTVNTQSIRLTKEVDCLCLRAQDLETDAVIGTETMSPECSVSTEEVLPSSSDGVCATVDGCGSAGLLDERLPKPDMHSPFPIRL